MRRERVSEDIYIFTSEMYAQVTASVILTEEGAIVIDTLPFPAESREMADFVHRRHSAGARYVINTHFHADHVYGNYLYPEAQVIGHHRCRGSLLNITSIQLDQAKANTSGLEDVSIVAPTIVFQNEMGLHLGNRSLRLMHLPGHSEDGIGIFVDGDRILFSGDAVMPVPYFGAGDPATLRSTLEHVAELSPENIVQGHGETLLRGEIVET
ncbi:MAG: MBL fold metallo-hydrolase, partial [Ardenticatenales bacterium]|nr:MBL fold metallo-hydrolase [Ardenticatenales bacterium]